MFDLLDKYSKIQKLNLWYVVVKGPNMFDKFNQYLYQYPSPSKSMSQAQPQTHPAHTESKRIISVTEATNRWNNISSDEDESESQHEERQQVKSEVVGQQEQSAQTKEIKETKQDNKKRQANIVPFDAKKKFRGGDFAHLKTVKGGFKAEKLEKKKFHLDTVKNPFAFGNQESSDSEDEKQEEQTTPVAEPAPEQPVEQVESSQKKQKKSKKQQEKEQLEALLKELGTQQEAPKQQGEKKKKKKKPKKAEEEVKEQQKVENEPVAEQAKPTEQFAVSKQALQELMRKKAETAAKASTKKSGKAAIASAAKKAIVERQAKNKAKKVYVDL